MFKSAGSKPLNTLLGSNLVWDRYKDRENKCRVVKLKTNLAFRTCLDEALKMKWAVYINVHW